MYEYSTTVILQVLLVVASYSSSLVASELASRVAILVLQYVYS
jgi:hypothetical protein